MGTLLHGLSPSFNAGELSPRLSSRVDFAKFPSGVETMENFTPLAEGGAMRRSGSRFVVEVKDSSTKHRLKRFEFSTTQAYMLEFGNNSIRFCRNQGQIFSENITASITNGTFDSGITNWTDQSAGAASITHDATNDRMNLVASGGDFGHAEQQVTNALAVEHIVRFQVFGAPGDIVKLRIGTSSTGTEIVDDFEAQVGYHTIAFTATAADFYLQFIGPTDKTAQVDNISLIDNAAVELSTPWSTSDILTVEGPQSADILYLFHADNPTYKLERRGHTTWSLVEVAWQDGPYLPTNDTTTTLGVSATTGKGVTLTASAITGINGGEGFKTTDVGRSVRLDNPTSGVDWGWGVITAWTSTTVVTIDVKHDFARTNADVNWRLGAWSGTTGYPAIGAFFEQRLVPANTSNQPQTFWGSQTANFESFRPDSDPSTAGQFDGTVEDDDAIDYTISADDVNAIFWLSAGEDTLTIGTAGGEWVPSSVGAVLTPSDISVRRQVTTKAAQVQPIRVDNVILFIQRAKRKIKEFGFAFESDGFQSLDMTRLAQHISVGGISEMAFAEEQESQVYTVRNDGQLLSMTFRRKEDVVGWSRIILGGRFPGGNSVATSGDISFTAPDTISSAAGEFGKFSIGETLLIDASVSNDYGNIGLVTIAEVSDDHTTITTTEQTIVTEAAGPTVSMKAMSHAVVESVATIPGNDGAGQVQDSTSRDEVWVIVKRWVNGNTKRYIEVFERDYEDGDDQEDAYYVDSLITYDSTATTAISGLDHLEGETVKILADGAVHADKTVSSGAITLDSSSKVAQIGFGYSHKLKTLRIEGGNPAGSSVGKTKRITGITFVLLNVMSLVFGPSSGDLTEVGFRDVLDSMDQAPPFFTGDHFEEFEDDWGEDPRIFIEDDSPTPFTLLAIAPETAVEAIK